MAFFSFHCQNYKSGALFGLDKHNRRLNKNYDNPDIDPERTHLNRIYVEPKETLYSHCKKRIHKEVIANVPSDTVILLRKYAPILWGTNRILNYSLLIKNFQISIYKSSRNCFIFFQFFCIFPLRNILFYHLTGNIEYLFPSHLCFPAEYIFSRAKFFFTTPVFICFIKIRCTNQLYRPI